MSKKTKSSRKCKLLLVASKPVGMNLVDRGGLFNLLVLFALGHIVRDIWGIDNFPMHFRANLGNTWTPAENIMVSALHPIAINFPALMTFLKIKPLGL